MLLGSFRAPDTRYSRAPSEVEAPPTNEVNGEHLPEDKPWSEHDLNSWVFYKIFLNKILIKYASLFKTHREEARGRLNYIKFSFN